MFEAVFTMIDSAGTATWTLTLTRETLEAAEALVASSKAWGWGCDACTLVVYAAAAVTP